MDIARAPLDRRRHQLPDEDVDLGVDRLTRVLALMRGRCRSSERTSSASARTGFDAVLVHPRRKPAGSTSWDAVTTVTTWPVERLKSSMTAALRRVVHADGQHLADARERDAANAGAHSCG